MFNSFSVTVTKGVFVQTDACLYYFSAKLLPAPRQSARTSPTLPSLERGHFLFVYCREYLILLDDLQSSVSSTNSPSNDSQPFSPLRKLLLLHGSISNISPVHFILLKGFFISLLLELKIL